MTYFISAPFGNFLQYSSFAQGATCVTGTFTLKPRSGRLTQILKTLRYVPTEAGWAWRNQLGLRNPGIFKGIENTPWYSVMSIASLEPNDWKILYEIVPKNMSVELNISCPNVNKHPNLTKAFAKDKRKWCIVKVPPTVSPLDLTGGVISISNLGSFNIRSFDAIILPGQTYILAVGQIFEDVYVNKGKIETANFVNLTLSCDHRAVDGVLASQFFSSLISNLEKISDVK